MARRFALLLCLGALSPSSCSRRAPGPEIRPLVAGDHDRLISLMGGIDSHLLEIQRGAADPIDLPYVHRHLASLREKLERARGLEVAHDGFAVRARRAAATVKKLEGEPWTAESREEQYAAVRKLCSGCHVDFTPSPPATAGPADSWQACGRCHERAYKEWKGTLHEQAWLDPVYRMSAGNPPKLECRGCHSMEPILAREITSDVSYRPVYRPYLQEEGVNCRSCHGLSDGSVAARRDLLDAPCRPRRDDRLRSTDFCGACHNPSHLVVDEWRRSKSGKSCVDCHAMREGKFSHRMIGVTDAEFVRKSVEWACDVKEGTLRISLTNRSGHRLPAEVPSRVLRVVVRVDGKEDETLFCRPPKGIVGTRDNRLEADETRVLTRPVPGARAIEVKIYYQQSPFMLPQGWITIGAWRKPE